MDVKDSVLQVFLHKHEKYVLMQAMKWLEYSTVSDGILDILRCEHSYRLIEGEILGAFPREPLPYINLVQDFPTGWVCRKRNNSMNVRVYSLEHTYIKELTQQQGFKSVATYVLTVLHVRLGYNTKPDGNIYRVNEPIPLGKITYKTAWKYIAGMTKKGLWNHLSYTDMKELGLVNDRGWMIEDKS